MHETAFLTLHSSTATIQCMGGRRAMWDTTFPRNRHAGLSNVHPLHPIRFWFLVIVDCVGVSPNVHVATRQISQRTGIRVFDRGSAPMVVVELTKPRRPRELAFGSSHRRRTWRSPELARVAYVDIFEQVAAKDAGERACDVGKHQEVPRPGSALDRVHHALALYRRFE